MGKLVECIPNFSAGDNQNIVDGLVKIAEEASGVTVLDVNSDTDHNRTGIALLGPPDKIVSVVFNLVKYATENIDLNEHSGGHPRMGASDVVPFVPIKDISMGRCIDLSKEFGQRVSEELKVPVFLYEESASTAERKNLANIRKGQFEGMKEKIKEEKWHPDFGEAKIHPTAGAVAIAARMPLIAFNVNLNTDRLDVAKAIARLVRESSGGYRDCKAIGLRIEDRDVVQVSMDIVNYETIPLYRVLETIRFEAKRYGVEILGTEVHGLAPAKALIDSAAYYLQLEDFDGNEKILENRIE